MPEAFDWEAAEQTLVDAYRERKESPEELFSLVYQELRQVARAYMQRERADHTLQATALVNEAYLRLFEGQPFRWENSKHLFCTVARAMRRVLVDHARKHRAERHGGAVQKVNLDDNAPAFTHDLPQLIGLDIALEKLAKLNPRQVQVVESAPANNHLPRPLLSLCDRLFPFVSVLRVSPIPKSHSAFRVAEPCCRQTSG